jgi:hypothetical protein
MGQILAVAILPKKSGLPVDAVQNSFAFTSATAPITTAEQIAITDAVIAFYNTNGSLAVPVAHWLSESMDTGVSKAKVELYDLTGHLDGSPHGSPIRTTLFTLAAVGAGSLPDEMSVCLSYHSDFGTDVEEAGVTRPKARDRGRIYVGPLAGNVTSQDATTKEVFVTPNVRTTLLDGAAALIAATPSWCVWSRASAALKPVTGAFVDNAFDVQRRRGQKATVRDSI